MVKGGCRSRMFERVMRADREVPSRGPLGSSGNTPGTHVLEVVPNSLHTRPARALCPPHTAGPTCSTPPTGSCCPFLPALLAEQGQAEEHGDLCPNCMRPGGLRWQKLSASEYHSLLWAWGDYLPPPASSSPQPPSQTPHYW